MEKPMRLAGQLPELAVRLHARMVGTDRERGDVPGWVLVTLMTAAIVTAIWAFAQGRLVEILGDALESVNPAD
jgi:hypothetical protein